MKASDPRPRSIFITYNGLLDPLGATQGLRYVEGLARERPMHVISFERPERVRVREDLEAMRGRVARAGIGWDALTYHQRPGLVAKPWDVLRGRLTLRARLREGRVGVIHARGYVPMEIATASGGRTPMLFDIRGLQGEEYLDAGIWTTASLGYRLLKRSEARFFRRADAAVVLTRAILPYVRERFAACGRNVPIAVIPTCVDTDRFARSEADRHRVRAEIGADDRTLVFAYSGSLGTWYMAPEMARVARIARDRLGRRVHLLWQVNNDPGIARDASRSAGLDAAEWSVSTGGPDAVAARLSAADAGLALIRPTFAHKATAPTKYAEYLALGMPVVLSEGVGDSDELVRREVAVAVRPGASEGDLAAAVETLGPLVDRSAERCRSVALELFDVERVGIPAYRDLYDAIEEGGTTGSHA